MFKVLFCLQFMSSEIIKAEIHIISAKLAGSHSPERLATACFTLRRSDGHVYMYNLYVSYLINFLHHSVITLTFITVQNGWQINY